MSLYRSRSQGGSLFSASSVRWFAVDWHVLILALILLGAGMLFLHAMDGAEDAHLRVAGGVNFRGHQEKVFLTLPLSRGAGPVSALPNGGKMVMPDGFGDWVETRAVTAQHQGPVTRLARTKLFTQVPPAGRNVFGHHRAGRAVDLRVVRADRDPVEGGAPLVAHHTDRAVHHHTVVLVAQPEDAVDRNLRRPPFDPTGERMRA